MIAIVEAAWVIARRDFLAVVLSKSFLLFLLGPLFPVVAGVAAGGIGSQVARDTAPPVIALAMSEADNSAMLTASARLSDAIAGGMPPFRVVPRAAGGAAPDPAQLLANEADKFDAVLTGSLDAPVLTGRDGFVERWRGSIALAAGTARTPDALRSVPITTRTVRSSASTTDQARLITAQAAQSLLFLLTMMLAGMVLSNLVEEKSNKILEVLAAAVPLDGVFLGKLFAMLAMALVGILVWTSVALAVFAALGATAPDLPAPAVGWPLFGVLSVLYFAMAYLILGSLFLGIGAMASTVREVQTLSMPVTMLQLIIFFFAMYSVTKMGEPIEIAAAIFPFSSPFAMVARAAQTPELFPHLVAVIGQGLFALLVLRTSVHLFRRNVMKSGRGGRTRRARRLAKV